MKKSLLFTLVCFSLSTLFAFEWPQTQIVQSDQFYSYFGQLRGGTISTSLIFSDPSEIKAADNGKVSLVLSDFTDQTDFFPSTLGNTVILSHSDNLITVYGNIDSTSLSEITEENSNLEAGTVLGTSGNSAWQQGHSSLEFQIIDIKNNTAINPRILMPRVGKELPLYYGEITLQNKNGRQYKIPAQNTIPSGLYRIYKKRQATAAPYRTGISINGTVVDRISYDVLRQTDLQLCASGRKNYPQQVIYPDSELQLMGEATLTPGKNALQLILTDILGKETPATYIVNVY